MRRSLDDAKVEAISDDLRFTSAFTAALTIANVALRAAGYRTATQAGHHVKTIESLEFTVRAEPRLIQTLKAFSSKRNKSFYDMAGAVTEQELERMIKLANEVQKQVIVWVAKTNPELLKG